MAERGGGNFIAIQRLEKWVEADGLCFGPTAGEKSGLPTTGAEKNAEKKTSEEHRKVPHESGGVFAGRLRKRGVLECCMTPTSRKTKSHLPRRK